MKKIKTLVFVLLLMHQFGNAQDDKDYTEFDDRIETTHGVYLGITTHYGEIKGKNTYLTGAKIVYVANKTFEVGFGGVGFYSEQEFRVAPRNSDIFGGYGGIHIEPYLFGDSKLNLSVPLLIGAGASGFTNYYIEDTIEHGDAYIEDWGAFFIAEPGLNFLYQISRFVQFEVGVRYRLSSKLNMVPNFINTINGFSGGIGIKLGVFDIGRNK